MSETSLQNRIYPSTGRIGRLRERILAAPMEVSTIRARAFTEARIKYAEQPTAIQRALAFRDTLTATKPLILEDEMIVGRLTEKVRGAAVYPEVSGWLAKDLGALGRRLTHRFAISPDEVAELEQLAATWQGQTAQESMFQRLAPDVSRVRQAAVVADTAFGHGLHLFYPDMTRVLKNGLDSLLLEARQGLEQSQPGLGTAAQADFYRAVEIVLQATQDWTLAYAEEARNQAGRAGGDRARELREIAAVLTHVAHHPAATFHQGLQMLFLMHLLLDLADGGHEIPYGRVDQLLYPLFAADIASGRLSVDGARELIEAFYIQASSICHFLDNIGSLGVDGNTARLDLTVGGVDEKGADATNELSYLLLSVMHDLRTIQPNVMVRIHRNAPASFLELVSRVMTDGSNITAVFNDEVIIESLTARGIELADARDYMIGGCVSAIPRGTYGPLCGSHVFMTRVMEPVVMGGPYGAFADLYETFKRELAQAIHQLGQVMEAADAAHQEFLPQAFVSALVEGPMARGSDVKVKGGRYNLTGMNFVGFANVVDSLAAIKHLVFETGELDYAELVRALGANFEGHEKIRQMLLNRAPKYGNDQEDVDALAGDLWGFINGEVSKLSTFRGGKFVPGLISATLFMLGGMMSAATADGRFARTPLAIGAAPSSGAARQGATAVLKSIAAISPVLASAGAAVNLRLHPAAFRTADQVKRFEHLLTTYFFALGGQHLQTTVVDAAALRLAKAEPEQNRDLMVRVAGYSARFIDLSPLTQDEIIARTEHGSL